MTDHQKALAEAADKYRQARPELQAAIRAACSSGMRQADILRAIDHVWSREYLRKLILSDEESAGVTPIGKQARRATPEGVGEATTALDQLLISTVKNDAGCWVWTGYARRGYGIATVNGRPKSAHRAVWLLTRGPIPDGLEIDHLCRNTLCVNPDHLEPVTRQENQRRIRRRKPAIPSA